MTPGDTHGGDGLRRGHHVSQARAHDVLLQVLQHGLDATGHFVHEREHQMQLCGGEKGSTSELDPFFIFKLHCKKLFVLLIFNVLNKDKHWLKHHEVTERQNRSAAIEM